MGEKRQHPRRRPVTQYVVVNRATDEVVGQLEDLSREGLKVTCKEMVDVGEERPLHIAVPPEVNRRMMLRFDARCMWCKPIEDTDLYLAGFEITHVRHVDRPVLTSLLQHLLIEQGTVADRTFIITREGGAS